MLTPARSAPPAAPDDPGARAAGRSGPPALGAGLGLVATLAALVFPFAPVVQPQVDYRWSAGRGCRRAPADALPARCADGHGRLRRRPRAAPGTLLLVHRAAPAGSGRRAPPWPAAHRGDGGLLVASDGVDLGRVALPPGPCTVTVTSDPAGHHGSRRRHPRARQRGRRPPRRRGAFSDVDSGVTLALTADTRFQTTISRAQGRGRGRRGARPAGAARGAPPCRCGGRPPRPAAPPALVAAAAGGSRRHRAARRLVGHRRGHRRRRLHRGHHPQPRRERLHRQRLPLAQRPRVAVQLVLRPALPVVADLGEHAVDAPSRHPARAASPGACCPAAALGPVRSAPTSRGSRRSRSPRGGCRCAWGCGPSRGSRRASWAAGSPSSARWPPAGCCRWCSASCSRAPRRRSPPAA